MGSKKAKRKPHPNHVYKIYSVSGGKVTRKNRVCPKCGEGTFMAVHKSRIHCGKCGYTEFTKKE